jgi:predicted RNA-binding Zn ribbon-like protein
MGINPVFFSGGLSCIDFCNTLDYLRTPPRYDLFWNAAALLEWGQAAGILPADLPDAAIPDEAAFARALEIRATLARLLLSFTRLETPDAADFALFNSYLQETSARMGLVFTDSKGYFLACGSDDPLEKVLCEAVRSTADLLLSNQIGRVKQCEECGWLFYDTTRNRSRRWCDMKSCGNRAKARRHYGRVRQGLKQD